MFSIKLRMVLKFRTLCALSDESIHQKAGEDALLARSVVYRFSYLLLLVANYFFLLLRFFLSSSFSP